MSDPVGGETKVGEAATWGPRQLAAKAAELGPDRGRDRVACRLAREQGYDTPEYMVSDDSLYHVRDEKDRPTGTLKCPFPDCSFRRRDVEAMFRHAHGAHGG